MTLAFEQAAAAVARTAEHEESAWNELVRKMALPLSLAREVAFPPSLSRESKERLRRILAICEEPQRNWGRTQEAAKDAGRAVLRYAQRI